MGEISTEKLIKAVKARPALYNKADPRYHAHNKYKGKIWSEVCREVYSTWNTLRPADKVEYSNELQKRWKSLRTCFTRELALQKKEQLRKQRNEPDDDGPSRKRKRYEHFNAMTFLVNPDEVEDHEIAELEESEYDTDDPLENGIKIEGFQYDESSNITPKNIEISVPLDRTIEPYNFDRSSFQRSGLEDKVFDLLKDSKNDEEDEDRQFMLSLVPSFRKLNDIQKFEAKIEMLKVLKSISFEEDRNSEADNEDS